MGDSIDAILGERQVSEQQRHRRVRGTVATVQRNCCSRQHASIQNSGMVVHAVECQVALSLGRQVGQQCVAAAKQRDKWWDGACPHYSGAGLPVSKRQAAERRRCCHVHCSAARQVPHQQGGCAGSNRSCLVGLVLQRHQAEGPGRLCSQAGLLSCQQPHQRRDAACRCNGRPAAWAAACEAGQGNRCLLLRGRAAAAQALHQRGYIGCRGHGPKVQS